jgi:hypothetical protein
MVNETELFYLVILILLTLIVHFVLTMTGSAAERIKRYEGLAAKGDSK